MVAAGVQERVEQERERRRAVAQRTQDFLFRLEAVVRQVGVHAGHNEAVQVLLEQLYADIRALQAEGEHLAMVFAEGHTFVNGVWVRATRRAWDAALRLSERLQRVKARGIVLERDMPPRSLLELALRLRKVEKADWPEELPPGVRLVPLAYDEARGASQQALDLFLDGLDVVPDIQIAELDLFLRRQQRAMVQKLVQLAEDDMARLLSVTAIRDPALPRAGHNFAVCVFAVGLGRMLDLGREQLVRLGLAALNHNLGESFVPQELLEPGQPLQPQQKVAVQRHPLLGMSHIVKNYGLDVGMLDRALVSAEHHLSFDSHGGYPLDHAAPKQVFSRIVAVADTFQTLCSINRHGQTYTPEMALQIVSRLAGKRLDPVLVRTFVRLVGIYPPGALVELDTGEWAVVLALGSGRRPARRPRVLLIATSHGDLLPQAVEVDLGQVRPHRRTWLRSIVRTHDAAKLGIPVAPYVLGERVFSEPGTLDRDVGM